ncbi:methyltransferase domain-containing protein [Endozoicomonas sp. SM1973]|uniref:Methyltransferase domain-containing protein n=1 Tax=Spartinivicinus marinus TaxID=2994442 RepID=A0A853ICG7_9GAMM|nr:pseudaminic acid biosynthesis-associated methylase [Spartinivicinus marinus]MCX4028798.1 methyltransferase domain-containing protein [Spartinivicinus marinus]NYZ67611.1 methyltransferase domain-containing protein [Spartinivicinus marinus]
MKTFKTEQEDFWFGEFGDKYITRNDENKYLSSNITLFSKILSKTKQVTSVVEFGCNIGLNLKAIDQLTDNIRLTGIEINQSAVEELRAWKKAEVLEGSILDYESKETFDFCLAKGVLIHINPEYLSKVYDKLYYFSKKYICICEYYNPTPVSLSYRGHNERLFKRDFAGEMLDSFSGLELVDYGFCYHRDSNYPQDDITWFLLKKI